MSSTWFRLLICFGAVFLVITALFLFATGQLQNEGASAVHLQALYALVMLLAFAFVAVILARRLNSPISSINEQLAHVDPQDVNKKVWLKDAPPEGAQLIERINELLSRVHLAMRYANQFTAQVAHELKTPLTILRLKIEQEAERINPELAEEFQAELLHLTQYVEQTLLIARSEKGQLALRRIRCNLQALLADVVGDFRLLAQEEERDILVSASAATAEVDETYMRQILQNLFSNAIRHGRGVVSTRLRSDDEQSTLLIHNARKVVARDDHHLGLGNRVVRALATAHGNMDIVCHPGKKWYAVLITISHHTPLHKVACT